MSITILRSDRVNNFREKSSAGIERPKLGACLEQDVSACELAIGQACGSMLVLEDAPIVMSAEGFINLLFGVFAVYLKPVFKGVVIFCAFFFFPLNADIHIVIISVFILSYRQAHLQRLVRRCCCPAAWP